MKKIANAIEVTLSPLHVAFRLAGVHPATGQRWLQLGERARSGKYREFYDRIEDAKARARTRLELKVLERARIDPKMALEVLSRRYPKEWARQHKIEVEEKSAAKKRTGARDKIAAQLERIEKRMVASGE